MYQLNSTQMKTPALGSCCEKLHDLTETKGGKAACSLPKESDAVWLKDPDS